MATISSKKSTLVAVSSCIHIRSCASSSASKLLSGCGFSGLGVIGLGPLRVQDLAKLGDVVEVSRSTGALLHSDQMLDAGDPDGLVFQPLSDCMRQQDIEFNRLIDEHIQRPEWVVRIPEREDPHVPVLDPFGALDGGRMPKPNRERPSEIGIIGRPTVPAYNTAVEGELLNKLGMHGLWGCHANTHRRAASPPNLGHFVVFSRLLIPERCCLS